MSRAKLFRSKKTGRGKGYGLIEFEENEVAKVAAKTMHGMIMYGKQLVCELKENVPNHALFPAKKNVVDPYSEFRERYNSTKSDKEMAERVKRLIEGE